MLRNCFSPCIPTPRNLGKVHHHPWRLLQIVPKSAGEIPQPGIGCNGIGRQKVVVTETRQASKRRQAAPWAGSKSLIILPISMN